MRGALGLIGLLAALLIVAVLVKQQWLATHMGATQSVGLAAAAASGPGPLNNMPQQVQSDLDRAAEEAAKRLEQAEGATKP